MKALLMIMVCMLAFGCRQRENGEPKAVEAQGTRTNVGQAAERSGSERVRLGEVKSSPDGHATFTMELDLSKTNDAARQR
jgi:hypothetical protein